MPYENAPSTRLVATCCCACGRSLRDAKSVELGIGPVCRRRYGFNLQVTAAARAEANTLVHGIAARRRMTRDERDRLVELGFEGLAARLAKRLLRWSRAPHCQRPIEVRMVIWRDVERLAVTAPYNVDALPAWRSLGSWDAGNRRWMVHPRDSVKLLDMLEQHYPGVAVMGLERLRPADEPAETDSEGFVAAAT